MRKSLFEKLLEYYNITKEDYEHLTRDVTLDMIPSPFKFKRMDEAVELVKKHISLNNKIVIYGDYDADGITGCSILVKGLSYLGYDANYYIPNRYLDGYGINEAKAQEIIDKKYDLVITVDNGIAANEPIKMLREAGIDVLVLDHHERQEELPIANVIIHPTISEYSNLASSGAFTAFMFISALIGRYDKYLSMLAAISLISDMMPLKDFNRDLLRVAIKDYKKGEFLPIDLLLDGEEFNETSIGLTIAPKINAVGRINKTIAINRLVKYFTSDDEEMILSYKNWIVTHNDLRKEKSKNAKEIFMESIQNNDDPAIVVKSDLDEGMLGLVANSLSGLCNVPAIVFSEDSTHPGILKGSARSIEGFNLSEAFQELADLEETFGGHAMAAGVSIKDVDFDLYKERFINLVKNTKIVKPEKKYIEISINDVNEENYELIKTFSPFGEEWKAPLLRVNHIKADTLMYSRTQEHIITSISLQARLRGFGFSKEFMSNFKYVDFLGSMKENSYRGVRYIEFVISDVIENK